MIDLNAEVIITESQFIIQNKDSFDWIDVELEINSGVFSSGYILKVAQMKAGETYMVGMMQFAKPNGERLNPFSHKPQKITIFCKTATPERRSGFYAGSR